jgi:hypothetical protein
MSEPDTDTSKLDRGDEVAEDLEDTGGEERARDEKGRFKAADDEDKGETPDEEVEASEEDKGETPDEEEKPEDKPKSKPLIPKARFDEQLGKEREAREQAERRARELEKALEERTRAEADQADAEKVEAKLDALEKRYQELVLDGSTEDAAKIRREIRAAERALGRAEADRVAQERASQALEAERFHAAVARLEADWPALNPASESYDEDVVEFILAKHGALVAQGVSPDQAINQAAARAIERFLKPSAPEEKAKGLAAAEKDRRQAQLTRNLDTAKRQPASMKDSGIDSDKLGGAQKPPSAMTLEELAALPESTLKMLRGDTL